MNSFSIRAVIREGWQLFKARWKFYLALTTVPYIVTWLAGFFFQIIVNPVIGLSQNAPDNAGLSAAVGLLSAAQGIFLWVLSMVFAVGVIGIYLDSVDGKNPKFADIFSRKHLFIRYAIGNILYGLIIGFGIILFIVPGIYFAMKYFFWSTAFVDTGTGVFASFRKSAELTRGIKMKLVLFSLVTAGLGILGMMALFVGILVVTPVVTLAATRIYRIRSPRNA